ncbi:PBECR2 nuclease fold domain-containing protein [Gilvimarinus agarilyticus]|uniref:PBECR2 nuclease fold domain-containing protein n=1 Tax=Gilvimarinus agarilyticus TaxID=679259 RepID=UPI0005A24C26|nr:PBECR2 nuclease fold domain-containing protein [Gilvimarinus agarilyticus]
MATASYGSVPFPQQIEFFRRKLNIPTTAWTDLYSFEHDWGFMVAGANRDTLVADFRTAVERAISDGTTLEQFRADFDDIVARHGWDYNGGRNWRSRVIYDTNLFSSYSAGRYAQLKEFSADMPYWRYRHSDAVENPREHHLAWDGLTLRHDDPFWDTHFPINAWGCQCYVEGVSEDELADEGKTGPDTAPEFNYVQHTIGKNSPNGPHTVTVPEGIDPGFEHAPGKSRLSSQIPPERPDPVIPGSTGGPGVPNTRPSDPLPAPRTLPDGMRLPDGQSEEFYAQQYLDAFGATLTEPAVFTDVLGERLAMGAELFRNKRTGLLKANKNNRGRFMRVLAAGVIDPDEIWVRLEYHQALQKSVVRRRYIAQFELPGEPVPVLAVFERGPDGWSGVTVFDPEVSEVEGLRVGIRLYQREE